MKIFLKCLLISKIMLFLLLEKTLCQVEKPRFRILAPQFICGENVNISNFISTPGVTNIKFYTPPNEIYTYNWTVRFKILNSPQGQRFNLLVWKAVRNLEKILTNMSSSITEMNMIAINKTMLMEGVDYVFNISAMNSKGIFGDTRSFAIRYGDTKNDPKFDYVDFDETEHISILLLGPDNIYADQKYIAECQMIPCKPTNDYYFQWKIFEDDKSMNIGQPRGKRLVISPGILTGNKEYNISCQIFRTSNEKLLVSSKIFLKTLWRGPSVEMNIEKITIAINTAFVITSKLKNPDNIQGSLSFSWSCESVPKSNYCDNFKSMNQSFLQFQNGLREEGSYNFRVTIRKGNQMASKTAVVIAQDAMLPTIEIERSYILVTSGRQVQIQATISNLRPTCNAFWTSVNEQGFVYLHKEIAPNGFGDKILINSRNEAFLSELVEFGNDTLSKDFPLIIPAATGSWKGLKSDVKYKFRLNVECSCPESIECFGPKNISTYSEVIIETNAAPVPKPLKVTPSSGEALKTVFRFFTNSASDSNEDYPMSYEYGYKTDKDSVILTIYIENLSVETLLPYLGSPLIPYLVVCDSRGACSKIEGTPIVVSKTNITAKDLDSYLCRFESELYRKEYHEGFNVASMILKTLENLNLYEAKDSTLAEIEQLIKTDIQRQIYEIKNGEYVGNANEFIQIATKFIEEFKVSDSLVQNVLKLRDELFEIISKNSDAEKTEKYRIKSNDLVHHYFSRRIKRDVTSKDLDSYIKVSEYVILTSNDQQKVSIEKKNVLNKLEKSMSDLCKEKRAIVLDWKLLSTSIDNINSQSGIMHIPYAFSQDNKFNIQNIGKMQLIMEDTGDKPTPSYCIQKSAFLDNFLEDDADDRRKGFIYYSKILDENMTVVNASVIMKLPVIQETNEILQCRRWNSGRWDKNTCQSNENYSNENGYKYVVCRCNSLGYFSLYSVEKIVTTQEIPLNTTFSTELTTESIITTILENITESICNFKQNNSCYNSSQIMQNRENSYVKGTFPLPLTILLSLFFMCLVVVIFYGFILLKRRTILNYVSPLKEENTRYRRFYDEHLMEGTIESLGKSFII